MDNKRCENCGIKFDDPSNEYDLCDDCWCEMEITDWQVYCESLKEEEYDNSF